MVKLANLFPYIDFHRYLQNLMWKIIRVSVNQKHYR
jgi:hypothetical protein